MSESVLGRRWTIRDSEPGEALIAAGVPPLTARLLTQRGVRTPGDARRFLVGDTSPADPLLLTGMPALVERLQRAIAAGERIAIFGDYDVDGITATAILVQGIAALGGDVIAHIPDRFTDGYGVTRPGLRSVRDRGAALVLTVDCGINANAEFEYAAEIGLDAAILDHHEPPAQLPEVAAIVDPKLGGGPPEFDGLASCGLAYTVLRALYATAGRSWDESHSLELAALGTVADMVPLRGENRRIVREGLQALRKTTRPGLLALFATARADAATLDAGAIGYRLAPRLNAAGRIRHAGLALDLLTTGDDARAATLAETLQALNTDRQQMTERAVSLARDLAASECSGRSLVMVGHPGIAQGVVGLVAGKLVEELYRPVIVYERGDELCRGSVRGIPEVNVVECLAHGRELMERWGGHSQAGGFTARTEHVERLRELLCEWTDTRLSGADLRPLLVADAEVSLAAFTPNELKWMERLEPCGMDNATPAFIARNLQVAGVRTMGEGGKHLRLNLRGAPLSRAVGFGLGRHAPRPGSRIDALFTLARDRYAGGHELHLKDFALAG